MKSIVQLLSDDLHARHYRRAPWSPMRAAAVTSAACFGDAYRASLPHGAEIAATLDPARKRKRRPSGANRRLGSLRPAAGTAKAFATELIQVIARTDADGRAIGMDYGKIRDLVIRRFPVVTTLGPHYGKATKMPVKELTQLAYVLRAAGVRLPFRPRRPNAMVDAGN